MDLKHMKHNLSMKTKCTVSSINMSLGLFWYKTPIAFLGWLQKNPVFSKSSAQWRPVVIGAPTLLWFQLEQTGIVCIMHTNLSVWQLLENWPQKESMWMGLVQWLEHNNNKHSVHLKDEFKPFCHKLWFMFFYEGLYKRKWIFLH